MTNLDTYLAQLSEPKLTWIQGIVQTVGDGVLTLTYGDGEIHDAAYVKHYTPVIGDMVHALSFETMGVLVLGATSVPITPPPDPVAVPPLTYTATSMSTWDRSLAVWTNGVLLQDVDQVACFFYSPAAFASIAATFLQKAEIEITRVSGGPPEFIAHLNLDITTPLEIPSDAIFWRPDVLLPAGVPTWVPLPVGWAQDLTSGAIKGISIWSDLGAEGVYSGTGRVRLTPLSVTI